MEALSAAHTTPLFLSLLLLPILIHAKSEAMQPASLPTSLDSKQAHCDTSRVEVKEGKIASIVKEEDKDGKSKLENVIDYGESVVMPGLIDVHAHLGDPGRSEWEGFPSGTKAAAASAICGITTLVDMPLNSFPSTVSKETLELKLKAAESRIYVDVGFWGGLVPENEFNKSALEDLLNAGALGLKSFMCPSGINDFPMTNSSHIKEAKRGGDSLTVETCPHYLAFSAEDIRDGDTRFKCSPSICDAVNKEKLWAALMEGDLYMTTPDLKHLDDGDFLKAWGGISCLQFVLPVTWSYGQKYGVTLEQMALWWSERPAKLAGQKLKVLPLSSVDSVL
ncbi:hypothetical protein ACLB2K_044969 [Fragaria x ananassa]